MNMDTFTNMYIHRYVVRKFKGIVNLNYTWSAKLNTLSFTKRIMYAIFMTFMYS
jgi:hypothetical protein